MYSMIDEKSSSAFTSLPGNTTYGHRKAVPHVCGNTGKVRLKHTKQSPFLLVPDEDTCYNQAVVSSTSEPTSDTGWSL